MLAPALSPNERAGLLCEIVDDMTGVLVPPGDIGAAVRAIDKAQGISAQTCRARAEAVQ